jgi:hypothetical protein
VYRLLNGRARFAKACVTTVSGIAVDAAGNACVTGLTTSTDFPGAANSPIQSSFRGGEDAFVAKIGIVPPTLLSFTATPTLGTAPLLGP